MKRTTAINLLHKELDHQNAKWGRADGDWPSTVTRKLTVLAEEFGEVAMALNDRDVMNLLEELMDTAASCVAWMMSDFGDDGMPYNKTYAEVVE
jgi:NTP pyrophosphatase (non-canonical NTP hydrolase)